MKIKQPFFFLRSASAIVLLAILSQTIYAHTVIEPSQVTEGKSAQLSLVVTHGCGDEPVIGVSLVFPDGVDSIIVANSAPYTGPLTDFLENWGGNIQLYQDHSIFSEQDTKRDNNGNVVGFWSGGGRTISGHLYGRIPFTSSPVIFKSDSCARNVRFALADADICKITTLAAVQEEDSVSFWTPAVGSKYDGTPGGHAYDFPVYLAFNRDLDSNPLPESCGNGLEVIVKPSAAQIDRDMPIIFNGTQVWPQP